MLRDTVAACEAFMGAEAFRPYGDELEEILANLAEYRVRPDQVAALGTATVALTDAKSVKRLTTIALVSAPVSCVATVFSMNQDVGVLGDSFGWLVVACLGVAVLMTTPFLLKKSSF